MGKQQLNILQTENDELKSEVRRFRYGLHDPIANEENSGDVEYLWKNIPDELLGGISGEDYEFESDEGYNSTDIEDFDHDYIDDEMDDGDEKNFPNFVTLTKLQPVLPPVILMGGKVKEDDLQEHFVVDEDDDEELDLDHDPLVNLTDDVEVEDELEEDHQEQIEDEKTKEIPLVSDYFKSFK